MKLFQVLLFTTTKPVKQELPAEDRVAALEICKSTIDSVPEITGFMLWEGN